MTLTRRHAEQTRAQLCFHVQEVLTFSQSRDWWGWRQLGIEELDFTGHNVPSNQQQEVLFSKSFTILPVLAG